ncbi:F-box protein At3g07870-like [Solanum verrucosum]|nr:F-box protein At3g07870-like [Solanum verrucosum]
MDVKSSSCKRRRISHVPRMRIMDLPLMILIEILSRLSIKPIFRCKTVCKLWYNLLSYDPLFANIYQTRSLKFPCIYLFDGVGKPSILELKAEYNYYARHCNRPIQLTPEFHYPPGRVFLVGLCNGFTCFVNGSTDIEKHFVYISNPLLGEYFEVKLPEWEISVWRVTYGFCFSKASGKYKVLRFVARKVTKVSELEVYTLGVGEKWRNVGEISCPVWYDKFDKVNINGALHWMDSKKNDIIYSFDIETEKVKSLPAPPGLVTPPWNLKLVELGNYLCLTDYYNTSSTNIDIWWMKEYGVSESWTKEIILVDSIPRGMVHINFEPILMWKDGEILIQCGRKLASYNPKMKSFRVVYVYGKVITAITYTPSFYSLKTIMGDDFQVTNVYPKTQIV